MLKACLNGVRRPVEHPRLPVTPADLAEAATTAIAAGAQAVHIHPKDRHGRDTLAAEHVDAAVDALRRALPTVPIGVTTGAWTGDPVSRLDSIGRWRVLPDFASVNWHEPGAADVASALLNRSIGVEAGLWNVPAAEAFRASGLAGRCLRVLLEPTEAATGAALVNVDGMLAAVAGLRRPILLHGQDDTAWPLLEIAAIRGLDVRIGLEDVLLRPDGSAAFDNAALVRSARAIVKAVVSK